MTEVKNELTLVNAEEFSEIKDTGLVVLDIFAEWCGPCKQIIPVLNEF